MQSLSNARLSETQKRLLCERLIRKHYKEDLLCFAQDICGYKDVNWATHGPIINNLEHEHRRKLIVTPRGCFKSSLCVVSYAMWSVVRNPDVRILITSEVYTNSKNFIREIKGHFESEKFQRIFGNWKGKTWGESEITVNQRTKNFKEASITAGGVGTVKVGQHYDMIIMDDVNSNMNSDTIEKANKIIDYYRYIISILEPDGVIAVIGTRYSEADLIGHILANECEIKDIELEVPPHNQRIIDEHTTTA